MYEANHYWATQIVDCWQGGLLADGDPDQEEAYLGYTNQYILGPGEGADRTIIHNENLVRGSHLVMMFIEAIRDKFRTASAPGEPSIPFATVMELKQHIIGHELGHSFGLTHGNVNGDIPEFRNNRMGLMTEGGNPSEVDPNFLIKRHVNLVRLRVRSPGEGL